jgi:hypothetical protein
MKQLIENRIKELQSLLSDSHLKFQEFMEETGKMSMFYDTEIVAYTARINELNLLLESIEQN